MGLVVKDVRKRWPGGCLVFRLAPELSRQEKERLRDGMAH